jgi:hypothetical protein
MQDHKPYLRIYSRLTDYFSCVQAETQIGDFIDTALFVRFIHPQYAAFVIRDSNSFKVNTIKQ